MAQPHDLICFSHLRWNFVYQRPQHLLSRAARDRRVFFLEEPEFGSRAPHLEAKETHEGVTVVRPVCPPGLANELIPGTMCRLLNQMIDKQAIRTYALWFYTPMAMPFSCHLQPAAVIYDCMDELSAFHDAPPGLVAYETQLLAMADVVFTGGRSLYLAKCGRHHNLHAFPSAVDSEHFARARALTGDPEDQAAIPHPRVGFFGVVDERMNLDLVAALAERRPDLHFVIVGPVVKIDPASRPQRPNLHWLGGKSYAELPAYLAGWEVAMMPFAHNAATRYISPTKTPEYLAGGLPVVSTSITDVVDPYLALDLVRIADDAPGFSDAIDAAMAEDRAQRLERADRWLAQISWDKTWRAMDTLIETAVEARSLERVAG